MATLGFVGLGTMGAGMVANLLAAGHEVRGYNRNRTRGDALVSRGLQIASTPADAAKGAAVVFVCVTDDAAVRALTEGPSGVLAGLERGTVLVDCGTSGFEMTDLLEARTRELGVEFLAAPVTGSKLGAENATLTFMVGGAHAALERVRPFLAVMGRHVVHVGEEPRLGQAAKYCLNMGQAVVLEGVLECFVLARRLDVPFEVMVDIVEHSAGKTGVGSFKLPYLRNEDYSPHFRLDLMHKDLHLALGEAERRRIPLPAAQAVRTLYDQGVAEGLGDRDFLVLASLLARWCGVRWGPE